MSAARIEELERRLLEARSSCVAAARTAEMAMERLLLADELADIVKRYRDVGEEHNARPIDISRIHRAMWQALEAWDKMRPS